MEHEQPDDPATKEPAYILRHYAGALQSRRVRSTGVVVTIYRSEPAGLDDCDGECPYNTVCETHGYLVAHPTLRHARSWAPCPEQWCEDCQSIIAAKAREG